MNEVKFNQKHKEESFSRDKLCAKDNRMSFHCKMLIVFADNIGLINY